MPRSNPKRRVLLLGDARQIHLQRWERYLAEHGFDVLTVSLESVAAIAGPSERIPFLPLLPQFVRYPLAVPAVRRIIGRFDPDIVNAHFLANYGVIAMLTGFRPWILSAWGSDIMILPDKSPFHMYRTRRVLASADYVTSDADVMSKRLIELGAQHDRVLTFPFGVDLDLFSPPAEPASGDALRILSTRKLEAVYNIETIVRSFPDVIKQEPSATLTIAGTGYLAQRLRAAAARTSPAESVHFIGHLRHEDIPHLLRRHDIYLSVPLSDTTSVSLLEAMACGLFPIASDIPANREWLEHNKNGFLVPPRDSSELTRSIIRAWRDPGLRRAAAARNRAIIEERAEWHRSMSVVTSLFERIVGESAAADLA